MPITRNRSAVERAANRRVEFNIMSQRLLRSPAAGAGPTRESRVYVMSCAASAGDDCRMLVVWGHGPANRGPVPHPHEHV